ARRDEGAQRRRAPRPRALDESAVPLGRSRPEGQAGPRLRDARRPAGEPRLAQIPGQALGLAGAFCAEALRRAFPARRNCFALAWFLLRFESILEWLTCVIACLLPREFSRRTSSAPFPTAPGPG